jgi:hypothetical protein
MSQLGALLGLRWRMIRSARLRWLIRGIGLVLAYLLWEMAHSSHLLTTPALETAVGLAPQAFLAFGVLAVVAPLTAGGGNELFPADQLVAYPVRPRTQFIGGLVLAPVNLVWVLQIFALVAVTSYLTLEGAALFGGLTTVLYIATLTVLGQSLAWVVVGMRQTRRGRRAVGVAAVAVVVTGFVVIRGGSGDALVDASPTRHVVTGVIAGAQADLSVWVATNAVLLALLVAGLAMGFRTCAWALRRPGDAGALREARPVGRRLMRGGPLRQLISVDRASVWRAPALRRGGIVLAVMPGLVAAGAAVPWESLIVMPGLVAAGAGLLFGVNAFCLDGSGALWLASMPHDPKLVARAKTVVLAETVLAAVAIAALAGSLRSEGSPTTTELVAIAASGLCATAYVVASCLSMSIKHPHRADLRGPRDQVSPPGALTLASVRLALPAAFIGACFTGVAASDVWWAPLAFGAFVMGACVAWTGYSLTRYDKPLVRARIVQVVAAG